MKALQRINSVYFLAGYLGFLATWILDTIYALLHRSGVKAASEAVEAVLRALSPHYNLARSSIDFCHRLTVHSCYARTLTKLPLISWLPMVASCTVYAGTEHRAGQLHDIRLMWPDRVWVEQSV